MLYELRGKIEQFIGNLASVKFDDPNGNDKVGLCLEMLKAIYNDSQQYDHGVTLFPKHRSDQFVRIINLARANEIKGEVDQLLILLSRIARERELRGGVFAQGADAAVLEYFRRADLNAEDKMNADYIFERMPKTIAEELLERLRDKEKEITKSIDIWNKSLEGWGRIIEQHEGNLKNIHLRYNFVELSKAFFEMFSTKLTEKRVILCLLIFFGILLIIVPGLLIYSTVVQPTSDKIKLLQEVITTHNWAALAPLLTIEVFLLYFFRILLHNYYSAKVQLLELDHKQALCAFIEAYTTFAKDKKDLSKFEALIFRPLSPDTKNIPSTVDAIDQITRIVKDFKK